MIVAYKRDPKIDGYECMGCNQPTEEEPLRSRECAIVARIGEWRTEELRLCESCAWEMIRELGRVIESL